MTFSLLLQNVLRECYNADAHVTQHNAYQSVHKLLNSTYKEPPYDPHATQRLSISALVA